MVGFWYNILMTKQIKITLAAVAIVAVIALIASGLFAYKNLRGVAPALKPPADDIGEIIEQTPPDEQRPGQQANENTTGFPLKLPDGFSIYVYAKNLPNARVMAYDPAGRIIVSQPSQGTVTAVTDENGDGSAENNIIVISGLNNPHGMAFKCDDPDQPTKCRLYIAESDQLAVYDYDAPNAKALNKKKLIDLSSGGGHFTRTIMFMPSPDENKLLISIGSSCNVCREEDSARATIQVYDTITGQISEYAKGLRNSVFMAIHPVNGKIWATEMGRDLLGDNIPPDEINIIEPGKNYGWPICYGKNIHDGEFDKNTYIRNPCMEPFETASYIDIQAHSAPLGLAFFPEEGWPEDYWYNALVAYHGSWNRSEPTGYKIVRHKLDAQGNVLGSEDFLSGWLQGDGALGRPVDILIQPGGTIFVSDDKAGLIYKILYNK